MYTKLDYVDEVYDFKGKWDVPSHCGLRIIKNDDRHVVIATELYESNPGTSVANFVAELATLLLLEKDLNAQKLVFIEHCPDRGSKLDFYNETFDRVRLDWDENKFTNPDWVRISREDMDKLAR
jgi:hypothetical protein